MFLNLIFELRKEIFLIEKNSDYFIIWASTSLVLAPTYSLSAMEKSERRSSYRKKKDK